MSDMRERIENLRHAHTTETTDALLAVLDLIDTDQPATNDWSWEVGYEAAVDRVRMAIERVLVTGE